MSDPEARRVVMEFPAISLGVALAIAQMALCAAFLGQAAHPVHDSPHAESAQAPGYSPPEVATALARRLASAGPSGMGEEQAPLAQR